MSDITVPNDDAIMSIAERTSIPHEKLKSLCNIIFVAQKYNSLNKKLERLEDSVSLAEAEYNGLLKDREKLDKKINYDYRKGDKSREECLRREINHLEERKEKIHNKYAAVADQDCSLIDKYRIEDLGYERYKENLLKTYKKKIDAVKEERVKMLNRVSTFEHERRECLGKIEDLQQHVEQTHKKLNECRDELLDAIQQVSEDKKASDENYLQIPSIESPTRDLLLSALSYHGDVNVHDTLRSGFVGVEKFFDFIQNVNIPEGINERETEAMLIGPFLESLGWSKYQHSIRRQQTIASGEQPDYCISTQSNSPADLIVEAKRYGSKLEPHSDQIENYLLKSSAEWGVLTNGVKFHIYHHPLEKENPHIEKETTASELPNIDVIDSLRPNSFTTG